MFIRSMLFAPGTKVSVMEKALRSDADTIIIDLEDSVAINMKETVRGNVVEFLKNQKEMKNKVYVRINSWDSPWGKVDLDEILALPVRGIMLPKAENASQLEEVAVLLPDDVELVPLIESAKGVLNALEIAQVKKVSRLAFGAVDFTLDINTALSKTGRELLVSRSYLVLVSRSAGILPPIDTVYPDIHDAEGLQKELEEIKCLGMGGKLLIHPKQIPITHQAFTPSEEEIAHYKKITAAFEEAERQGVAAVQVDGKMVDYPVYLQAIKKLDMIL